MPIIELKNIVKEFGNGEDALKALDELTLSIEKGGSVAIVGPSGSGKSTLLNVIGCLTDPSSGSYLLDENEISRISDKERARIRNRKFGYIVQNFALINDFTCYENIAMPLEYARAKGKKEKIHRVMKELGIFEKKDKYPPQLSGGQRQRVAIARALVNEPDIILADEPTGALDQMTGTVVMDVLMDICNNGKTVIIVTHDRNIASRCSKTVNIVDGKVVNYG